MTNKANHEAPGFLDAERSSDLPSNDEVVRSTSMRPGQILLALGPDGARRRLVYLVSLDERSKVATVCLVSNEVSAATDRDLIVPQSQTGLAFPIVLETDLLAPIYLLQLGNAVATLGPAIHEVILAAADGDLAKIPAMQRGMPVRGSSDARWEFKIDELSVLESLTSSCSRDLATTDAEPATIVDPRLYSALLDLGKHDPDSMLKGALRLANEAQGARTVDAGLEELLDQIQASAQTPEIATALQPLFEMLLNDDPSIEQEHEHECQILPRRRRSVGGHEADFRALLESIGATTKCSMMRVLTDSEFWEEASEVPQTFGSLRTRGGRLLLLERQESKAA